MNKFNLYRTRIRGVVAIGVAITLVSGSTTLLWSADTTSNSSDKKAESSPDKKTNSSTDNKAESKPETKPDPKPEKKPAKKKLTGAELYQINCNRCHPERYPTEFNSAQWKTIMLHMRVRANLPAEQAKAVLKYLQEDSGKP